MLPSLAFLPFVVVVVVVVAVVAVVVVVIRRPPTTTVTVITTVVLLYLLLFLLLRRRSSPLRVFEGLSSEGFAFWDKSSLDMSTHPAEQEVKLHESFPR